MVSSSFSGLNHFTVLAEWFGPATLFGLGGKKEKKKKKRWVAGDLLLGWKAEEPSPVSPHPLRPPTSARMSGCDNYAPTSPLCCPHLACLFQEEEAPGSAYCPPHQLESNFIDLPRREDWKKPRKGDFPDKEGKRWPTLECSCWDFLCHWLASWRWS